MTSKNGSKMTFSASMANKKALTGMSELIQAESKKHISDWQLEKIIFSTDFTRNSQRVQPTKYTGGQEYERR